MVTFGKAPGGSTISQQLAKILFTTHERALKRKVYEIFCVFELEKRFTKDDILTIYLNSIFLGHGTYGIQDASNFYFGKDAGELSIGEAALLIGMNRSPERYSPIKYPVKARNLQISILNQLKNRGFLDKNEIDYEVSKFWTNFENRGMGGSQSFWKTEINRSGYITEYIRQTLEKSFSYDKITEGGLTVETTIDLEKQNLAENIVSEQLKYIKNKIVKTAERAKLKGYEEKDLKDLEAS
ncbi:MAG TPA: transglycosylase domain-containing protein, partial [Spirochaetota bacterium]|nr:transglycosylase domain-containing protein [Spirochaetota bacterium]